MPERMRVEVAPDQEVIALVYHAAKPYLADITLILGTELAQIRQAAS